MLVPCEGNTNENMNWHTGTTVINSGMHLCMDANYTKHSGLIVGRTYHVQYRVRRIPVPGRQMIIQE